MQKTLNLLFFLLLNCFISSGQEFEINSPIDSITKYKKIAAIAYGKGDLKTFKKYTDTVLNIAIRNNFKEIKVRAFLNLAIYHQQVDQYEKSLSNYLEAEVLADSVPDTYLPILVKINLSNLYNSIGNYEKANTTNKQIIKLADKQNNADEILATSYNSLSITALNQKKYLVALAYAEQAKKLSIKINRKDQTIRIMINISECYLKLKRYDDAYKNSTKILKMITTEDSVETKALAQLTIGVALINLKKPRKAIAPIKEAKKIAIAGNFLKIKMESHQYLTQIYESLNSLKNSLEEQKNYIETREQYLKTLSKARRLELEKESETKSNIISKQQDSISFLSKEKQLYVFLGIGLTFLLIITSISYWKRRKKLINESLQLQDDKALLKNENEVLKDKLNTLAERLQKSSESSKQKKSSLSLIDQKKYMKSILNYMDEKKPYLNHDVKQSEMADELSMSVHLLSEILNICFNKNFNNFINLYRVDMAKQLIKEPKYKNYKILSIGYEAGFPSKTSFNRVFKTLVGVTPSEYRKEVITFSNTTD